MGTSLLEEARQRCCTCFDELSALLQEAAEGGEPCAWADHDDGRGQVLGQAEAAVAHKHRHARAWRPLLQVVAGNALVHATCKTRDRLLKLLQMRCTKVAFLCCC